MRLLSSLILISIFGAAIVLPAASKQQEKGEFLFPTNAPLQNQNKFYGKQALEDKLFKNAIRYFTLSLQDATNPQERAEITADLAKAYLLDGNAPQALKILQDFLATNDDTALAPAVRRSIQLTSAQANIHLKNYTAALDFLKPLLETSDSDLGDLYAQVIVAAADAWNATGQWTETQRLLTPALVKFQNNPQARANLVWRLLKASVAQKQWSNARTLIANLKQMSLNADEQTSLNLSTILCDVGEGKLEGALAVYRSTPLDQNPPPELRIQWWDALSIMAKACQGNGLLQDAAKLFGDASKVAPSDAERLLAVRNQVEALTGILTPPEAKEEAYKKAEEILDKLPEKARSDVKITMRLAEIRRDLGNRKSASELFLKVADNETVDKKTRYDAFIQAALCFSHEQMRPQAEKAFRQAETLTDSNEEKSEVLRLAAQQAEGYAPDAAAELYIEIADRFGASITKARNARLEAGRILVKIGKKLDAIEQFKKLLDVLTADDPIRWETMLSMANATDDDTQATNGLLEVARKCPDKKMSCDAFMDAHSRALKIPNGGLELAQKILDEFLQKHPDADSNQIRLVRLKNIILGFLLHNPGTPEWSTQFINDYSDSVEAPEVALRTGDWYANLNDFEKAIGYYQKVASFPHVEPKIKRMAHYEEALCSTKCQIVRFTEIHKDSQGNDTATEKSAPGLEHALTLIQEIRKESPIDNEIRVQADFLEGDILATQGKTDEAISSYTMAMKMSKDDLVKCALLGRMAELYFSQGKIDETKNCTKEIYSMGCAADRGIAMRTKLYETRCAAAQGHVGEAIDKYRDILIEYQTAVKNNPQDALSPNVFINAANELYLLLKRQDTQSANQLANAVCDIYEKCRKVSNLPPFPYQKSEDSSSKH